MSLHAQVVSQFKQEQDAKALLEKALLPLMDLTLLRVEFVPSTEDQPNPTINKVGTDDKFVTLDYKVNLWIDESEYYNYVKNSLIPVLNQIAIRKGELTANYSMIDTGSNAVKAKEDQALDRKASEFFAAEKKEKGFLFGVLTWKDKGLTTSKWQWFVISKDQVPQIYARAVETSQERDKIQQMLSEKVIEVSLLDEKNEMVALGNAVATPNRYGSRPSNSPIALNDWYPGNGIIRIVPYFTYNWAVRVETLIIPPKLGYFTINIKVSKEDLPRIKSAKLEVKRGGGN